MKKIYLALMLSFGALVGFGQTTGDIAFVGFNSDGDDDFAIVTFVDIPASTVIYFSDNELDGTGTFNDATEATFQWSTGASIISAGTIVVFNDLRTTLTASIGTATNITNVMNFANAGDAVFAFLGADEITPTTFLAGVQSAAAKEGDLTGSGLVEGSSFVTFSNVSRGGYYSGARNSQTSFSNYLALIGNSANWTEELTNGENILPLSQTAFTLAVAPVVGFDEASSVVTENTTSFEVSIPVSLINYGGSQVDLAVAITGGTAEGGDYLLNTTTLSFTSNGSMNISIDVNDDADFSAETIEITLTESTSTGILITPAVYTLTINDDDDAPLVITEIMYNPAAALGSDNNFEYIEIYNSGSSTVDLDGYTLSDSFDGFFTSGDEIAAGEYIVMTIDAASYTATGGQVFQWTSGSMQNAGETIVLKNNSGTTIDEVAFDPAVIVAANGNGSSLSLFDITADNSDMTYWIGSGTENGTPGVANTDITVWTATSSTDWVSAGNWSNGVPAAGVSAVVLAGGSNPTITSDIEVASLKVGTGVSINVSAGTAAINDELILDGSAQVASGASLPILGKTSGSGSLTVLRNTTGNGGYSILGAPVEGVMLTAISADYLYGYNEATGEFVTPIGTDMESGAGFFVGYDAASPSVSFTGSPVSGAVTAALTFDGETDHFNLVANPYAAAISISSFLAANSTDTDGSIYLWDDGGTNEGAVRGGDYITVNSFGEVGSVDLVGTGQTGTGPASSGFIASTQGFFVNATVAGNITFNADMQVTIAGANADANHYRKAEDKQLVRLSLTGNGLYNELLIGFVENATTGRDYGLDALKFSGNEFISFYSMQENEKYAIQALPRLNTEITSVQLGMDLAKAGEYLLSLNEIEGISDDVIVSLIDHETGTIHNLRESNEISFTVSGSLFNSERFELLLSPVEVLGASSSKLLGELIIFSNEQGLNVQTLEAFSNVNVKIYTMNGSVVLAKENVDFSQKYWNIEFDRKGLFVLTIHTNNGILVQKFLN